jgi:hypothetical protein
MGIGDFFERRQTPKKVEAEEVLPDNVKVANIINELKVIVGDEVDEEDGGTKKAAVLIVDAGEEGTVFINGNGSRIRQAILHAAMKDEGFKAVIMSVAQEVAEADIMSDDKAPKELKEMIQAKNNATKSGKRSVDKKTIDEMTEDDVDRIVNGILKRKDTKDE